MVAGKSTSLFSLIAQEIGLSQQAPSKSQETLQENLELATESKVMDIPKELINAIAAASHDKDKRVPIMKHLHDRLSNSACSASWRRTYATLVLTEGLMRDGSPELVSETARGMHFDLLQRVTFLQHFACSSDLGAQKQIRAKATAVRAALVEILQSKGTDGCDSMASTCGSPRDSDIAEPSDEEPQTVRLHEILEQVQGEWVTKQHSYVEICGAVATWSSRGAKASLSVDLDTCQLRLEFPVSDTSCLARLDDGALFWGDGDVWSRVGSAAPQDSSKHQAIESVKEEAKTEQPCNSQLSPLNSAEQNFQILNGMVAVGHSEDTTSESSEGEANLARNRGQCRRKSQRERNVAAARLRQAAPSPPVDLLA